MVRGIAPLLLLVACENHAPSAPVLHLGPSAPQTTDDLSASVALEAFDPDGDPVTYRWQWRRDGSLLGDLVTDRVPSDRTNRGEAWTAEAIASDGLLSGPPGTATLRIGNTAPSLSITIEPAEPLTTDDLTLVAESFDADGDDINLFVTWLADDQESGLTGAVLGAQNTARYQTWTAVVTAFDDELPSEEVSASVQIANTPPQIDHLSVSPTNPTESDDLVVTVVVSDVDNDTVTVDYEWEVDGDIVLHGPTASTLPTALTHAGDVFTLTVTASDLEWETSETITVTVI